MARCIAQNAKVASANFDMASSFFKDCRELYSGATKPTKSLLIWPHSDGPDSTFEHHTAATVHGQRGLTSSMLHLTEAAFYPYEGVFTSLLNTLSMDPNNICLVETTANGQEGPGEAYYQYWEAAMAGDNEFLPIFLPWWEDPAYILPAELAQDAPRDEYEKFLMTGIKHWKTGKTVRLGKDRIAWFRETLSTKCEGILEKWRAEMPSTPQEAFVATGNPAFTIEEMQFAENAVIRNAPWQGRCVLTADQKHGEIQKGTDGPLVLYETPQKGHHYFAGVDSARGKESTMAPGDYAAVVVWNAETGDLAGRYMSRVSPEELAPVAAALGYYFNSAMLNVELNNIGYVTMKALRDTYYYPNQYLWKGRDDRADRSKQGQAYGFETSDRYRKMMFALFRTALHEKRVVPKDRTFVDQMKKAKLEMNWRWTVAVGHDDVLMCFSPKELVETQDGLKHICDIEPSEFVRTHTGELHQVRGVMSRDVKDYLVSVGTMGNPESVQATPNHPFYVCRYGWNKRNGELIRAKRQIESPSWKAAIDLRLGDSVLFPKRKNLPLTNIPADQLWIMGWYLAERSKCPRTRKGKMGFWITFSLNSSEREVAERLCEVLSKYDPPVKSNQKPPRIEAIKGKNAIRVHYASRYWHDFFARMCGGLQDVRRVHSSVYNCSGLLPLVGAFMSGDGSQPKGQRNSVQVSSTSRVLIHQIRQILIDEGIWSTISKPKSQEIWTLCASAEFIERFVGISKFHSIERKFHKRHVVETEEGFWAPIKSLELVPYSGLVFNLDVEGDHTYQAQGVAVHNSGFLGWIALEQYHPTACHPRSPKNILMTKEELETAGFEPSRGQMPQWLRDPSVTGSGMLLTTGSDHLKKLEKYNKAKQRPDRLGWI
jgi:hypothetical protein